MTTTPQVPKSFWVISGIALVWNLIGAMSYIFQVTMSPETLAEFPEAEQALYAGLPAWVTAAFAIAVWGGLLGCILLLMRKKLAIPVLILSLVGVLLQNGYYFFGMDIAATLGGQRLILPILVVLVSFYLVYFAKGAQSKGWIS